mmetsp:Transcript_13021/g.54685  ORF Transcript_13021/g.54685 Transcript_13021/m.54685 type:complete len:418 (+) Transcript_13021:1457-2710(+)
MQFDDFRTFPFLRGEKKAGAHSAASSAASARRKQSAAIFLSPLEGSKASAARIASSCASANAARRIERAASSVASGSTSRCGAAGVVVVASLFSSSFGRASSDVDATVESRSRVSSSNSPTSPSPAISPAISVASSSFFAFLSSIASAEPCRMTFSGSAPPGSGDDEPEPEENRVASRGSGGGASLVASVLRSAPSTSTTYAGGSTERSTATTRANANPLELAAAQAAFASFAFTSLSFTEYSTVAPTACGPPPPQSGRHRSRARSSLGGMRVRHAAGTDTGTGGTGSDEAGASNAGYASKETRGEGVVVFRRSSVAGAVGVARRFVFVVACAFSERPAGSPTRDAPLRALAAVARSHARHSAYFRRVARSSASAAKKSPKCSSAFRNVPAALNASTCAFVGTSFGGRARSPRSARA